MSMSYAETVKEAAKQIRSGLSLLDKGPLEFYLTRLSLHSEALLTKFCPMPKGTRVELAEDVPCDNGWKGCERTLAKGASGIVADVGYDEHGFYFAFLPDKEIHLTAAGTPSSSTGTHTFSLRERWLRRIDGDWYDGSKVVRWCNDGGVILDTRGGARVRVELVEKGRGD